MNTLHSRPAADVRALRLAVLLSGTGRTLENLLRWQERGELHGEVVAVASNRPQVRGLALAEEAGIPAECFRLRDHADAHARDHAMGRWIGASRPDLVVLAGYLALLHLPEFGPWPVVNIHPSLLPRHGGEGFYGERVHAAVLAAGDRETGCTVHRVDAQFDRGTILAQARVEVLADDTTDTLAARVFEAECQLYPATINRIARGEIELSVG